MLSIAMPMIASNTCDTVMLFTDRIFLSRLGPEYMSASMIGGLTNFMILSFFFGLIGYSTAVTAQYFGAGDREKYPTVTFQAILIALLSYPVIMLILLPLGHMIFNHSGIAHVQLVQQRPYFNILMAGSIFWLAKFAFSSFFSGIGRTRIIFIASACSMVANAVMCYGMVFGRLGMPALGISGAGYSTVLSNLIGLFILSFYYFRYAAKSGISIKKAFRFDREILGKIIRYGFSAGLELLLSMSAFTAMIFLFHAKGLRTATSVTIVFNWDHVAFVPLMGLEVAVTSLFGRYVGAQRLDIAQKTISSGLKTGMIYSLGVAAVFVLIPHALAGIFRPEHFDPTFKEVENLAVFMIRTASIYVAVEALISVYAGALRGAGDTFWAMLINVSVTWAITFAVYLGLHVFNLSLKTSWLMLVFIFLAVPLFMFLRFKSGKWKKMRIA